MKWGMTRLWWHAVSVGVGVFGMTIVCQADDVVSVPGALQSLVVATEAPTQGRLTAEAFQLRDPARPDVPIVAQASAAWTAAGLPKPDGRRVLFVIPPPSAVAADHPSRRLLQVLSTTNKHEDAARYTLRDDPGKTLSVAENGRAVLSYCYGAITDPDVPTSDSRRTRGCYVHPLYGMQGEVLTADFPRDHYHHHGLFWAWPYVRVGAKTYDLWEYRNIEQRFRRWLRRETGPVAAVIGVENGWFADDHQVMTERVWLTAYASLPDSRIIDVTIFLIAGDQPVTLQGRERKSYGGLTLRYDVWPRKDAHVRVPGRVLDQVGNGQLSQQDLVNTPLPWADLASRFAGTDHRSGAAVMISPTHPDFPPSWLTRTYGALCVGWPGVDAHTIAAGQAIRLDYRVWIHGTELEPGKIDQAYQAYCQALDTAWESQ